MKYMGSFLTASLSLAEETVPGCARPEGSTAVVPGPPGGAGREARGAVAPGPEGTGRASTQELSPRIIATVTARPSRPSRARRTIVLISYLLLRNRLGLPSRS